MKNSSMVAAGMIDTPKPICYQSLTLLRIQGNPVRFRDGAAAVNGEGSPVQATAKAGRQGLSIRSVSQKTYP